MTVLWSFDRVFQVMRYPAGESHVEALMTPSVGDVILADRVRSFEDLGNVLTADRILKHNRAGVGWFIPYFPFARHDRRRHHRDGLELQLALELVRDLDLTILDPHSDMTAQLRHIPQLCVVNRWIESKGLLEVPAPLFVIPDAGATKKAHTWLNKHDSVQAHKVRNPATGELSNFAVEQADRVRDRDCILVDDICDGGGTFIGLAEKLHEYGAASLTLAVSHGLFTKGTKTLSEYFERIFTTGANTTTSVSYAELHHYSGVI